jgi:branched-chain amino acid transport system ATP-binding protein
MLKIANLSTHYGRIEALKGISLEVGPGEIVSLIGSNGAGKSTALMTISGIIPAATGDIFFNGVQIRGLKADAIVRHGLIQVAEGRRIFSRMSVRENLLMGAFLQTDQAAMRADLDKVFGLFPILRERLEQQGGTLSGGEQQMLAIGRALMARPRLLMLDEPSLGLAPRMVETIFSIIQTIQKDGIPILLVEQNAAMALSIASRGYVMETGRIVLFDSAEALLHNEMVRQAYLGG